MSPTIASTVLTAPDDVPPLANGAGVEGAGVEGAGVEGAGCTALPPPALRALAAFSSADPVSARSPVSPAAFIDAAALEDVASGFESAQAARLQAMRRAEITEAGRRG